MELGLRGRTAIVAGASSGLGLASAEALCDEGANVTMLARRREELELARAVDLTLQAFGGIDIVVWNSGGPPPGTASTLTDDQLESAFELLLTPAIRLVRACLPHLRESTAGRVILITSGTVKEPAPYLALSNTFRPGLTGWAKSLSRDLGPDGITVNCVAPGRIDTPRMTEIYGTDGPPAEEIAQIPLGRLGSPREFGDVVCFLASDRASYVNGTTVLVDGGAGRSLL